MNVKMPADVSQILDVLHGHGYEAYAVGGCIRDSILGRIPDDWDITTSATPYQVKELFRRTIDTGIEHGTVTVMIDHEGYEVTTYRIDGEYEDGRHPKEVSFTSSLTEDLKRRDFTINAMAYSKETGLIDKFGGVQDLQDKVIRCVGDPLLRFGEDALRILRAVRFAAQLGFQIEEKTKQGIISLAPNLSKISSERIQVETVKLLVSGRPSIWRQAYETGITKIVMPEFDQMMESGYGDLTLESLEQVENDKVLRLTMLFHHMGKSRKETIPEDEMYVKGSDISRKILKRLKFDNDTIRQVCSLVKWHGYYIRPEASFIRHVINQTGEELFPKLLKIQQADLITEKKDRAQLCKVEHIYDDIKEKGDCVSLKGLAVTGKDLIRYGIKPGPQLGDILEKLLDVVLDDPSANKKERLLEEVERFS